MRARTDDRGFITPLVPFLAIAMLLLGGLVVDGSRQLNARSRAVAYAEEAARAGASAVRPGGLELDRDLAEQRVLDYCGALAADEAQDAGLASGGCAFQSIEATTDEKPRELVVRVRVSLQISPTLLGIVGVRTLSASAEGRARPYEGVDAGDVDDPPPAVTVPDAPPDKPGGFRLPLGDPDPCDLDNDGVPDEPRPPPPACPPPPGLPG
ncbi:MAG TPA: Tad domain-containing protein [Mycobacteriales bacterium]|nr:Tad domain-containing protein [Mycobacteriales bacterium]